LGEERQANSGHHAQRPCTTGTHYGPAHYRHVTPKEGQNAEITLKETEQMFPMVRMYNKHPKHLQPEVWVKLTGGVINDRTGTVLRGEKIKKGGTGGGRGKETRSSRNSTPPRNVNPSGLPGGKTGSLAG